MISENNANLPEGIPDRLRQQLEFAVEIDKEKNVLRQTHLTGHGRREDDAEHAWHMAVMAAVLSEYSDEEINTGHTILLCLIHDLVEIYAGDTYAYDEEGKKTQKRREEAAKDKLFSILPEDQKTYFADLFEEFEAAETPEARFARAMDNLQPLLLNNSNDGGDWREHGVNVDQVEGRQKRTKEASKSLYELTEQILEQNVKKGSLKGSPKVGKFLQ